jgi:uncharacterized protein YndB with AHSA1/START domain
MTANPASVIRIDRVIPAAIETVYRAITTPDLFERWMGPEGSSVHITEMNVTVGGRIAFHVDSPDGHTASLHGTFRDLEPPSRIVHTWADATDVAADVSTVTYELSSESGGTRLVLTHVGVPAEDRQMVDAGWGHVLGRLSALAASLHPDASS